MNTALAMLAAEGQASAGQGIVMILGYVIVFVAFIYFLMIRPQKKQQAQMILRAGLRKADSLPEFLYMIHLSSKTMTLTTSLAPIWNLRSLQI